MSNITVGTNSHQYSAKVMAPFEIIVGEQLTRDCLISWTKLEWTCNMHWWCPIVRYQPMTHWSRVAHIYHYLDQCWDIINSDLRNKRQWNIKQNNFRSRKYISKYHMANGSHFVCTTRKDNILRRLMKISVHYCLICFVAPLMVQTMVSPLFD